MTRDRIKQWVVMHAPVNNPYGRYWSASTTICYDINGEGETIEDAYNALTDIIFNSIFYTARLKEMKSFQLLNPDLT